MKGLARQGFTIRQPMHLFIERLWGTVADDEVYLKAYQDGREDRVGVDNFFRFYNTERPHQAFGYRTPAEVFNSITIEATNRSMVESLRETPYREVSCRQGWHTN